MSQLQNLSRPPDKIKSNRQECALNVSGENQDEKKVPIQHLTNQSFISIHSTDNPCILQTYTVIDDGNCNLEVLSVNNIFPSTSEESVTYSEEVATKVHPELTSHKSSGEICGKYAPSNSKSSTVPGRNKKEVVPNQSLGFSDYDIPKSTMYVVGSNPGEPKINYADPPKRISKTMKKFLRTMDKHKTDVSCKLSEKTISKLTMRGILKDSQWAPECTGDSERQPQTCQGNTMDCSLEYEHLPYQTAKSIHDKNVTFNTQVVIIHLRGDLCVGQSVDALSKEKDQQARNSELRRTYLTKYNEFWPNQRLKQ